MTATPSTPDTAWQAGRLRTPTGPQRVIFGQMFEDTAIELQAFEGKGRVFCIASAGSTAIDLSRNHDVVACDINPVQLAYAEQRVAGGPPKIGEADRAMAFARKFMPLIGWREGLVREFLALSDVGQQLAFWREHLDTWRFQTGFDLLMSPAILRFAYASEFLSCLPPKFGAVVRKRLERGIGLHSNASNPYLRSLFLPHFQKECRASFQSRDRQGAGPRDYGICENGLGERTPQPAPGPGTVKFVLSDAASYLESCAPGSFDAFTLSNILDGAKPSYRDRLSAAVRHAASKDAVVVMRSFGEPSAGLQRNYAESDRAMLWGVVDVRGVDDSEAVCELIGDRA